MSEDKDTSSPLLTARFITANKLERGLSADGEVEGADEGAGVEVGTGADAGEGVGAEARTGAEAGAGAVAIL